MTVKGDHGSQVQGWYLALCQRQCCQSPPPATHQTSLLQPTPQDEVLLPESLAGQHVSDLQNQGGNCISLQTQPTQATPSHLRFPGAGGSVNEEGQEG